MIFIIHGAKGTGKTKNIIDRANNTITDGVVVFITDTDKYIYNIKHSIRVINAKEYDIETELGLLGFIRGLIAGNSDIQHIYIDGSHRLCKKDIADMELFYNKIGAIADKANVDITITASTDDSVMPEFIKKYL